MAKQGYKHENAEHPISQKAYDIFFKEHKKASKYNEFNDGIYWREG